MVEIGKKNPKVAGITAAMSGGTGFEKFQRAFPKRFFDVAIAEQHGTTFAAGLAKGGVTPVFAVYSSFLQRAYDQIVHDVCMQELHVVFAIDRAGIVGADGETHQGVFDISFLSHIPNMTVLSPKNAWELEEMLDFAVNEWNGPIAVRYPRGTAETAFAEQKEPITYGKAEGQGHCRSGGGTHAEAGGRGGRTLRGRRASPHACEYALSEPSGYGAAEGDR